MGSLQVYLCQVSQYSFFFAVTEKKNISKCSFNFQTPLSFMTDNSAAEKAALLAVWPEATQLLCHFHVAQAEWHWLHASSNKISRDERRELMTAFQKVCISYAP